MIAEGYTFLNLRVSLVPCLETQLHLLTLKKSVVNYDQPFSAPSFRLSLLGFTFFFHNYFTITCTLVRMCDLKQAFQMLKKTFPGLLRLQKTRLTCHGTYTKYISLPLLQKGLEYRNTFLSARLPSNNTMCFYHGKKDLALFSSHNAFNIKAGKSIRSLDLLLRIMRGIFLENQQKIKPQLNKNTCMCYRQLKKRKRFYSHTFHCDLKTCSLKAMKYRKRKMYLCV